MDVWLKLEDADDTNGNKESRDLALQVAAENAENEDDWAQIVGVYHAQCDHDAEIDTRKRAAVSNPSAKSSGRSLGMHIQRTECLTEILKRLG